MCCDSTHMKVLVDNSYHVYRSYLAETLLKVQPPKDRTASSVVRYICSSPPCSYSSSVHRTPNVPVYCRGFSLLLSATSVIHPPSGKSRSRNSEV